jgi:uncharacterized protein YchJ
MSLQTDLLALERRFWTGDAEFYRHNLDDRCLTAFASMAGVATKDEIADSVGAERRWQDLTIELRGLLEPTDDIAIVTYKAAATRENGPPYSALVSSGYVKRDGAWKMAFHQQTPLARDDPDRWPRDPEDPEVQKL